MSVPILDLQDMQPQQLAEACEDWGFFILTGHNIPKVQTIQAFEQLQRFFQQSKQAKNRIRRTDTNCWGYYDAELTKNKADAKEILDVGAAADQGPLKGAVPQWPQLPNFQTSLEQLETQLHKVAIEVVDQIAKCLGEQLDIQSIFGAHSSFMRMNYYPPISAYEGDVKQINKQKTNEQDVFGIHHHTDAGAVTVLLRDDCPGLEVLRDNQWHAVPIVTDSLTINIGDIVQVWSNDRFVAPLHRVRTTSNKPRISVPYFLNPTYEYNYAPFPACVGKGDRMRYERINWGKFRAQRSAGDYADHGREIQISDFAII